MGARRQFEIEFKIDAVAAVAAAGGVIGAVARELGVAPSTLRGWVADPPEVVEPPLSERSRVEELRSDFDLLGGLLVEADGSAAAAIARERRILGELLESLESPREVSVVDQLAARRDARAGDPGPSSRRRKPG